MRSAETLNLNPLGVTLSPARLLRKVLPVLVWSRCKDVFLPDSLSADYSFFSFFEPQFFISPKNKAGTLYNLRSN